jgi:MFS family permease
VEVLTREGDRYSPMGIADMVSNISGTRGGWYYGWNVVVVCVMSQIAANGLPFNAMSLFLKPWSEELHIPVSEILIAYLPMMIFTSALAPFVGSLADRKPARFLMGIGLIGMVFICLAMSSVTRGWQLQALYALALPIPISLSASLICNPLVSRWFVKRLGLALGFSAFGISAAGIVLPPLLAELMPVIGWRNIWLIAGAVIGIIVLPLVLVVVRDRPSEREGLHYIAAQSKAPIREHGQDGSQLRWVDVIKRRNFQLIAILFTAIGCIYIGCMQNIAPIAHAHGFDQKTAGMLISVLMSSYVASTVLMGAASDKFGNRLPMMVLALVAAGGALLLGFGTSLGALICGAAAVGFSGGKWAVLAAATAVEFGAADMGRAFGMLTTLLIIQAAMPSVIARVQEVTGSYAAIMVPLAVFSLISAVLILQFRQRGAV